MIESLRTRAKSKSAGVKLGIGDDCAILTPPRGHEIAVTTDFSLETIHFLREWHPPESVGHRCLARGLSDLAAMGAQPLAAFLSLALPAELLRGRRGQPSWRDRFFNGFLALANRYRVPLAGGDTAQSPLQSGAGTRSGLALADIVVVGSAPRGRALRRCGAKPGDRVYVTGHLGGSAAELAQLAVHPRGFRDLKSGEPAIPNPHPHLFPQPRLEVGAWLLKHRRATAAIDISDGLSTDLDHICQESNLAATVDPSAIPMHSLATSLDQVLHGGEDYELLFAAAPTAKIPRRIAGVPVACVGIMRPYRDGQPRILLTQQIDGKKKETSLLPAGWEHYR